MKLILSVAALGAALVMSGAGMTAASAAPAKSNNAAIAHQKSDAGATDFSARRRGYGYGPRYGYRGGYYGRPYGYARPYGYGGYGYGGPRYYGGYGYGGPGISFGFGGPRFGFY